MAITPFGADEYGFTYNGESSKTYGVYITDGAMYSAPVRDVSRVEIPGRNGAFLQDHGRFNNIQVVYRCTLYTEAEADFITGMANVRAWLCSIKGYARLTDDFNPNEFRMAAFVDGIGVSNIRPEVGTFDITFECKPQRFLTSGETAQTIAASGDTLMNPTLFNSRPMLEVAGYGSIFLNDDEVEIISRPIGRINLLSGYTQTAPMGLTANWRWPLQIPAPDYLANLNTGDGVEIRNGGVTVDLGTRIFAIESFSETGALVRGVTGLYTNALTFEFSAGGTDVRGFTFQKGTAKTATAYAEAGIYIGGSGVYVPITLTLNVSASGLLQFSVDVSTNGAESFSLSIGGLVGNSTKSALGEPIYLDLDIGEAWKVESGQLVSVNSAVSLGYEMPELVPGTNTITFDNTVTQLKIVPRWWTV